MKQYFRKIFALGFVLILAACSDQESPLGESVENELTKDVPDFCLPNDRGEYDDKKITVQSGKGPHEDRDSKPPFNGEVVFATGGGCVKRNLKVLWQLSQTPEFVKWTDNRSQFKPEEFKPLPLAAQSKALFRFESHYTYGLPCVAFGIKYGCQTFMEWSHILGKGSVNAPQAVYINYKKTLGSPIAHWQGSIEMRYVSAERTSVRIKDRLATPLQHESLSEKSVRDFMEKLRNQTETNETYVK